jgi:hypothetical protein
MVGLILCREREDQSLAACSEAQLTALEQQVRTIPAHELLAVIRRHRLECCLQRDPLTERLLPELAATIRFNARRESLATLALVPLIRELTTRFEEADLPLLVVKGIPLALQTTGQLSGRGSGDVDMLVDPRQLAAAVELLEGAGFRRTPGQFPQRLESLWGRYSRWAYNELPLTRSGPAGIQRLDLHWALSNVRGPLPTFEEAWEERETLHTHGVRIATLCRVHAFEHACLHAAVDQWNSLRHLIDVDRLAAQLPASRLATLSRYAAVRSSCAATFDLSGSEMLERFAPDRALLLRSTVRKAFLAQALPPSREAIPWTLKQWWCDVWRQATLSPDGRDWLRVVCFSVLWPGAFSDPVTGRDRGLLGLLHSRLERLLQRLRRSQKCDQAR